MEPHDCWGAVTPALPKDTAPRECRQHETQVTDDRYDLSTTTQPGGSVSLVTELSFSESLLVGLTAEQREAVMSPHRQLLIRATAGAGKTHVLTLRIQRQLATEEFEPDHILAMTFTRKAADELRQRLYGNGMRGIKAGTFHRAAIDIVSDFRRDNNLKQLVIEPSRRKLLRDLMAQMSEAGEPTFQDWQLAKIEQELAWALSQGFNGTTYGRRASRNRRTTPVPPAQMADIIDRYVGLCAARGVVDFDLLLMEAIAILRDERAALASFRHRHRSLFVDEAQDMNPLQFSLLRLMAGDDPTLFCVGDPNQSIYGFNGASPALLKDLIATWPETQVLDLTRNHRSTANIVAVADTLLDEGAAGITPAKEEGEIPLIRAYDTDDEEARQVAAWLVGHYRPGTPWRAMAVLARTNQQLIAVADALRDLSVPFERKGADYSPGSDVVVGDVGANHWFDKTEVNAITLSTIHRAKGLEWQVVAVIGLAEGVLPHFNATTEEEIAEERRLAYVALTRAEDAVLLTWNRGRHDPRTPEKLPSRFLGPIEMTIQQLRDTHAPLTGDARRARLAAVRQQLGER